MSALVSLAPIDLMLRVSQAAVGAGEQPPNTNRGPYVRRVLKRCGLPEGHPWCAAVITDWGLCSFDKAWPVPRTASVVQMAEWAKAQGCRYIPSTRGDGLPQVGDLYVKWYPKKNRFAHVGLVIGVDGKRVRVRDGNTSDAENADPELQREGWGVFEKWRVLTKDDRLVRWVQELR